MVLIKIHIQRKEIVGLYQIIQILILLQKLQLQQIVQLKLNFLKFKK